MKSTPPPGFKPLWDRQAPAGDAPLPSGAESAAGSLDQRSRRLLRIAALLGVLLIAVVVNSWLHSDGNPFNPLAAAAERTQAASGYSARIEAIYSAPELGAPIVATGDAEYNAASGLARATLSVPTPSGTIAVESVGDASRVYVRSPAISGDIPGGAEWIGVEPLLGESSPGFVGADDPRGALEMLHGVGDVESLGKERLAGVETHRYRGTIDLGHLASLFDQEGDAVVAEAYRQLDDQVEGPIELEVWLSPKGFVRQERLVSTISPDGGGHSLAMDMRITIDKLGVEPDISLPDSSQVYDATPVLREQLEGLGPSY